MKLKYISILVAMLLPMVLTAQISVTFEEQDYNSLGV